MPGHRHLCFGRDHGGPPEGELLFWVNISGDVAEIELIWYTDDPPATWPAAGDLWIAGGWAARVARDGVKDANRAI